MVLTIHYPANIEEWYAKGTAEGDVYFEVPAIFDTHGVCVESVTLEKVERYLASLKYMRP